MIWKLGHSLNEIKMEVLDERDFTNVLEAMDLTGENVPFFDNVDEKWGWKNEVLLLESVQTHGLFNWGRIAKILNYNEKTFGAKEVEDHYKQYYLEGTLGSVWNMSSPKELEYIDHTLTEPAYDVTCYDKYYPLVTTKDLRSIKFMPHREEFQDYANDECENLLSYIDFIESQNMKTAKGTALESGQFEVVDIYRRTVAERIRKVKFMKDFKLIEQYFLNGQSIMTRLKSSETSPDFSAFNTDFMFLLKYVKFFDSLSSFYVFYHNIIKEILIKMEIRRLQTIIKEKTYIKREPVMYKLMNSKAPV